MSEVLLAETTQILAVAEEATQILAVAEQGPPGPQGIPGPADTGALDALNAHESAPNPHPQYVQGTDPRLTDARTPTGGAGGVLSGSYPNPGFAVDMATQAELDAHANSTSNPHATTAAQVGADPAGTAAAAVAAHAAALDPHPTYTTAAEAAAAAPVQSVAGRTGAVTLAKGDVGLGNVDNTSDASKPVSTAQAAAIATATAIHPLLLIGA